MLQMYPDSIRTMDFIYWRNTNATFFFLLYCKRHFTLLNNKMPRFTCMRVFLLCVWATYAEKVTFWHATRHPLAKNWSNRSDFIYPKGNNNNPPQDRDWIQKKLSFPFPFLSFPNLNPLTVVPFQGITRQSDSFFFFISCPVPFTHIHIHIDTRLSRFVMPFTIGNWKSFRFSFLLSYILLLLTMVMLSKTKKKS